MSIMRSTTTAANLCFLDEAFVRYSVLGVKNENPNCRNQAKEMFYHIERMLAITLAPHSCFLQYFI